VFGTELVKGKKYTFGGGSKIAVFTWQGCLLELRGKTEAAYVARETPMIIYLNTHAGLEQVKNNLICTFFSITIVLQICYIIPS